MLLIADLKELGLMKCVLKYGGGGIGGGASNAGGALFGVALTDDDEAGISLGDGAPGVSACVGTPIVVFGGARSRSLTCRGVQK